MNKDTHDTAEADQNLEPSPIRSALGDDVQPPETPEATEGNVGSRVSQCGAIRPPELGGDYVEVEKDTSLHRYWCLYVKLEIRDRQPCITAQKELYVLGSCLELSNIAEEFLGEGWHRVSTEGKDGWLYHAMSSIEDAPLTPENPVIPCEDAWD